MARGMEEGVDGKEGAGEEYGSACRAGADSAVWAERDVQGDGVGAGEGVLVGCASCFGGAAFQNTALCCGWMAVAERKVPVRKG